MVATQLAALCFLFLVMADSFGLLVFRLSTEAWGLLQIGLGGYVVGRSVEKIAPQSYGGDQPLTSPKHHEQFFEVDLIVRVGILEKRIVVGC